VPAAVHQAHRDHPDPRVLQGHRDLRVHPDPRVLPVRAAAGRLQDPLARLAVVADPPVAGAAASQAARPVVAAW
jgi:hypothetical protein